MPYSPVPVGPRGQTGPRTLGPPDGGELAGQKQAVEVCLKPARVHTSWDRLETSLGVQALALMGTCIPNATVTPPRRHDH